MIKSLYRQRALLAVLVVRELRARYRGTFLGYLWSLLNPLLLLTVYTVVFTFVIPARAPTRVPYALFLFAGLLPWLFASGALLDAAVVLADNGPLLKKVVCPPEVFPAVTVLSHLVHHLLALPVLLAAMGVAAFLGRLQFPWTFALIPVAILLWVLPVAGLALAVAGLAVHFKDLKDLLHNLLNLFFFLTPIIYSVEQVPQGPLRRMVMANPVAPLVEIYRSVALLGTIPPLTTWLWAVAIAVVFWTLGALLFARLRETIVEAV